jgi:hypothetical protein
MTVTKPKAACNSRSCGPAAGADQLEDDRDQAHHDRDDDDREHDTALSPCASASR